MSGSSSSSPPPARVLDFTTGTATGSLEPWLLEKQNRIREIDPDAASIIFDQKIYVMPVVPPEPTAPTLSSGGTSSEKSQMKHEISMHSALTAIRSLATKKVS